jgi:CO/xanthine dehydrogenase Mo-binding subunit
MDPVEFRLNNVVHDGDDTPTGQVFKDIIAEEVIKEAAKVGKMSDPRPSNVGRGIAYGHRPQYGGGSQSSVTVNEDGSLTARTSVFEVGVGTYTLIQQSVAEEMEVPLSSVHVVPFGTDEMFDDLFDFGMGGSRGSMVAPQAAIKATRDVKNNLKKLASEFNGWDQDFVEYEAGDLINTRTQEKVHMKELVKRSGEPILGRNFDPEEGLSPVTSFVAQVAEVEIDPDTGQVKVLKITAAHDVGKILNPVGFHGQVEGGMVQALGHAVMEDLNVDEGGRISNPSLADYTLPNLRGLVPTLSLNLVNLALSESYNLLEMG